jgi:quercetin 2,3-dioxygenase
MTSAPTTHPTYLRRASDRGNTQTFWLDSYHTFSFGDYYAPEHRGFNVLRVINDDYVRQGQGFGTHPHHDMEIITYVLEGQLAHKDSLGNGAIIRPGEIQRMSAGTGIEHSEFNPSETEPVHFLQIWILPDAKGHTPSYEQKALVDFSKTNSWQTLVDPQHQDGAIAVQQDVRLSVALLEAGETLAYTPQKRADIWVHVVSGQSITIDDQLTLAAGDGVGLRGVEATVQFTSEGDTAHLLVFEMPSEQAVAL